MEQALKHGGVLYASFRYGDFEGMLNGRYFTYYTGESLTALWESFPDLKIFDRWISQDARPDRKELQWINLLARRA